MEAHKSQRLGYTSPDDSALSIHIEAVIQESCRCSQVKEY
jgi:hypothetical protein